MLREIRNAFVGPRIVTFGYTTNSNAVTQIEGVGDVKITSAATGSGVASFYRAFGRNSIVVANTSSVDVAAGGFTAMTATPSATGFTLISKNPSNAADDGTVYGVALGFEARDATRYRKDCNVLVCRDTSMRVQAFQVNTASSGTIVINKRNATLTRNGTGDVTLAFRSAFGNDAICIATPVGATCAVCNVAAVSATSCQIKCTNSAGSAADAVFNLLVIGDGSRNAGAAIRGPVRSDQRLPYLFGYTVIYTSGVPAYTINSGDATLTDTATGRATFTFKEAFARESIVCAMPISAGTTMKRCQIDTSSSTGFEVKHFSAAPALEDPADTYGFNVIGIGFDDSTEY